MARLRSLRPALLAAATLLAGCTAVVPLDVTRDVALEAPAGAFEQAEDVDLTASQDAWSHRNDIDAVSVDQVSASVLSVGAGNAASAVTLTIRFRADGAPSDGSQDLTVGTLSALPLSAGSRGTLAGSSQLDAFVLAALHGSGHFAVVASGSLDGPASAVLRLEVTGSASYTLAH